MKKLISLILSVLMICSVISVGAISASAEENVSVTETFLDRVKEDYDLVWSDEFNGDTLDTTKWVFDTDARRNSELQYYTGSMEDGNLAFDGESAIIIPKVETRVAADGRKFKYTSAEISTQGRQAWKYGYFEIRAKQACGKNVVPAIWMMGYDYNTHTCDWPYSGEIDIMERLNNDKATESTLHHGGAYGQKHHKATGAGGQSYDHKINEQFHNYWLYWTDKYLVMGVDDAMHSIMDITIPELAQSFRTFEHWLILNVALGMFANPVDDSQEDEWKMYIDYVRVYQLNDDKLYENYKTFSTLDIMNNGNEYAYGKTVSTLKTESSLDFTITDELEPGKYDIYTEINNKQAGIYSYINGVKTNEIAYVDHGKAVGNQAYVGSVDLQDESDFDITFKGKDGSGVTIEKLIFVKTDDNKTTPVVVNKDNCVTVSDYFEVSTEDELVSAAKHLLPNGTIKLKNDITLTKNVQLFNNDIIDLNGKTITANKGRFLLNSDKEAVTIKNGNVVISGDSTNFIFTKENNYGAKVKCEDLNITINSTASSYVFNHNYGAINIEANNCTFTFGERVSSSSSYMISRNAGIYNNCTFNLNGKKAFLMSNGSNTSTRKLYFNSCTVNDALYLFHSDKALTNYVDVKLANTTLNNLGALTNFAENAAFFSIEENSVLKDLDTDYANMTGSYTMECNHNYVDADCLLPKHCEYCNLSEGTALGHTPVTTTTPADCLYKGSIKTECSTCFTVLSQETLPVTEHNYKFVSTTEPTCTQAGYHLWTCSDCGMNQQRSYNGDGAVIRPAHTYDESQTVVVAPTCTMGGYSLKYCTSCKTQRKTLVKCSIDHDYESTYNEDEGSVTYTCKDCGESYVDACIHQATEGADVVVEPTCVKQGYTEHTCSVCGKTYKDGYKDATGVHIAKDGFDKIFDATCKAQGYTEHTCIMCSVTFKDTYVPKLPHTEVEDKGYAATCEDEGLTDGSHCSVCGETIVKQSIIGRLGHIEKTEKGYAATCEDEGLTDKIYCDREGCGMVLEEQKPIPATGHKEVVVEAVAPTCTKGGKTEGISCETCGEIIKKSTGISATGHKIVTLLPVAPTYTKTGLTIGAGCANCGLKTVPQIEIAKRNLGRPKITLKAKGKKLTVKYKKITGAQKYEILIKIGKKWKKFDTKKLKLTKKLQKGKKYQVKVRAYVVENGVKAYSKYSTVKKINFK